ncbi:hypothetical protein D1007_49517 [Hordeum vulgare]|nr:hypothetical protein D1007_49517 [Hordeum vulgare]
MPQKEGAGRGPWGLLVPATPRPTLERSAVVNLEGLEKVGLVVSANPNELGATKIQLGSWPRGEVAYAAIRLHFHALLLVVLPPFSGFLDAVLSHYQIQALYLDPCSLILLSAFAFLCEAFVGVTPSMALLRHLFSLELASALGVRSCKLMTCQPLGSRASSSSLRRKGSGGSGCWLKLLGQELRSNPLHP